MPKLSPVEIQFRKKHAIYFTCDEKFSLDHKCASKHYFLIQSVEEVIPEMDHQINCPDIVIVDTT